MITMISCPNFEKPKPKTGKNPLAASPTADFAALFTAPVSAPATNNPFQKPGAIVEAANFQDALPPETNLNSSDENSLSSEQEIQLQIFNNQTKSDFQPANKNDSFDQAGLLIENNIEHAITEAGNARADEKDEFSNSLPDFFVAISKVFQAENNLTAEQEIQTVIPEIHSAQNVPLPVFSSQIESEFQPGNNTENKTAISNEAEMLVNDGIESGLLEILDSTEGVKINSLMPFDSSEPAISQKAEKDESANRLPDFFTAMANVFKSENYAASENTDFSVDFNLTGNVSGESPNVGKIELNFAENGAMNLSQPEKALPEAENLPLDADEVSIINFNKFAAALSNEQTSVENSAQVPVKTHEVLAQVEPQMLYLASLTVKENEKKVMKMRLHPAELGMVEITLERGSSGNLTAHFQTESEATRRILTESINELRQSLEDSGWQIERLEITCAAFSSNEKNEGDNRGKQAREFQTAENQPDGAAAFDNKSDSNADDKNDFRRKQSNRFVSLRA